MQDKHTDKRIGFIGQGYIGKNYANDFENRGYSVIRYALEKKYRNNGNGIKDCDIVFIAVPTPTTPEGFNSDALRSALGLVGKDKTAVIKSTLLPKTTKALQEEFPDIYILHSPEFLTEANAAYDAAHPQRNIVGIPDTTAEYQKRAQEVLSVLPKAPYESVCSTTEAELIKYGGNNWFYFKVIYINLLYDLVQKYGGDWQVIRDGLSADPRIGSTHLDPTHQGGRGAGGNCFIKDFAAFRGLYEKLLDDPKGIAVLYALEEKNKELLRESGKNIDLLKGVYGE